MAAMEQLPVKIQRSKFQPPLCAGRAEAMHHSDTAGLDHSPVGSYSNGKWSGKALDIILSFPYRNSVCW